MVTFVLSKVAMHPWSHSCDININSTYVMCFNTRALVSSFGSAAGWG